MNGIVEVVHVNKTYKGRRVLSDVSLSLERGKGYGFVGPNGCGKSVLFKVICGFVRPTEGKVIVDGKRLGADIDVIRDAGVIIETPEFINDLSGFENLLMLAQIKKEIGKPEIMEVLERIGLVADRDKKVRTYSLGMKQRLRIAQALMENPPLLILDEPMNSLDKQAVSHVREILKQHVRRGGTLLLTSHHSADIEELCDTVYEMEEGRILA